MSRIRKSQHVVSERRQYSKLVTDLSEFTSPGLYFTNIYIYFRLDEALHSRGLTFYRPNHYDFVFSFQCTKELLNVKRSDDNLVLISVIGCPQYAESGQI